MQCGNGLCYQCRFIGADSCLHYSHAAIGRPDALAVSSHITAEHREQVRNLLSNIRAIVQRTAVVGATLPDYVAHLSGRLDALGRMQEILMREPGEGTDLGELVTDEFLSQGVLESLDAPSTSLLLERSVAAALVLAVHELVTNAIKFGQLQGDASRKVTVRWSPSEELPDWAVLEWQEQPLVPPPLAGQEVGFGFTLIRNLLPAQIAARTRIDLTARGLFCKVVFRPTLTEGLARRGRLS